MAALTGAPATRGGLRWALTDAMLLTKRSLLRLPRVPETVAYSIIQPIMFVVLFAYVFGGAIPIPGGGSYREFLMGGVFTQTVAFSTAATAVGLADDMHKGLIDRFRSLPMSRSAVLAGRTTADLVQTAGTTVVMAICGLLVGWRIHTDVWHAALGFALLLLFSYSMCWIGALIGMSVRTPETASTAGIIWLFPVTFISAAFVPTQGMPVWMQYVADWNPVTAVAQACRELWGNPHLAPVHPSWLPNHPVAGSLIWSLLIIAVFAPLGVRKYRRTTGH